MPEKLMIKRVYEVELPDDRNHIEAAVDADMQAEDAAIVKGSDGALALWLTYKADGGDFTDICVQVDVEVEDMSAPNIEEFTSNG